MPHWTEEEFANYQIRQKAPRGALMEDPASADLSIDLSMSLCPDMKAVRKIVKWEEAEQITYFERVRDLLDADGNAVLGRAGADLIFSIRNENTSGAKGLGILAWKMGVKAGLPDIMVAVPGGSKNGGILYAGLYIELKCSDGVMSDVSTVQKAMHSRLEAAGYRVAVAFGWRRAWRLTCEYLGWEE